MEFFNLDPTKLEFSKMYRIDYPGASSTFTPSTGFRSGRFANLLDWDDGFEDVLEMQFDWRNRIPTPFISVFSDRTHAENWALKWSKNHAGEICTVYEIDIGKLGIDAYIFDTEELYQTLHLHVRRKARASIPGQYLILHLIPAAAIGDSWSTVEIIRSRGWTALCHHALVAATQTAFTEVFADELTRVFDALVI